MGLPLQVLPLPVQRYSCHGCGDCCRDFTVQLSPEDLARLERQGWRERLGEPVTVEFQGQAFLRQRDDGACIFLMDNGLCRVHSEFGFDEKPLACRVFPFSLAPGPRAAMAGINFACQSVRQSRGAALPSHMESLRDFQGALPEARRASVIRLSGKLVADEGEVDALIAAIDGWLTRLEEPFEVRLDGLAWIAQQLMAAKLDTVRGRRFEELLDLLVGALPDELLHLPIEAPSRRQMSLLRQAVFARTEDPKIPEISRRGRLRTVLSQLWRSRRFSRGKGVIPPIGLAWPRGGRLERVAALPGAARGPDAEAIEELMTRWLRATILGGRAWGSGFYGWPMTEGLGALIVNLASLGWLARAHAVAEGAPAVRLADVSAALGRIDRSAGRARWLGGSAERLRLEYFARHDGLRRLTRELWFASPASSAPPT
ncbi:MAG: YkgJ family cysteine cluster protein [Phycisphaeraceae bacterium]|nr:YkgJ family cysteine cluster protein [Phycisphaeraceae bacterium]